MLYHVGMIKSNIISPVTIRTYNVKTSETTLKNELKVFSLLHYLEDIAYIAAEEHGFGYSAVAPRDITWFVLRYHVKFNRLPKSWESLTLVTWPTGMKGVQCFRDFELFSADDEKIAEVSSAWALIDLNTKRPLIPAKTLDFPKMTEERLLTTDFSGSKELEQTHFEKVFEIRFDDIDINQHVNNANYLAWALESLPCEFKMQYSINEFEIAYKKEASYGSEVLSTTFLDGSITFHKLQDKSSLETLCDIKIYWI